MSTINPADYPSNSHKPRTAPKAPATAAAAPEKKIKKVVTAPVTVKKKSGLQKFAESFIAKDAVDIKDYLVNEVVIPTVKDTIWAAITNSIEMVLWGTTSNHGRPGSKKRYSSDYVSYSSYSAGKSKSRHYEDDEPVSRSRFDPEDIVFTSLRDAEAVLDQMADVIDTFGQVTINDLYDMVDRTPPVYTATKYGWTHLDGGCKPVRVRDGYILKLPKARPLID